MGAGSQARNPTTGTRRPRVRAVPLFLDVTIFAWKRPDEVRTWTSRGESSQSLGCETRGGTASKPASAGTWCVRHTDFVGIGENDGSEMRHDAAPGQRVKRRAVSQSDRQSGVAFENRCLQLRALS